MPLNLDASIDADVDAGSEGLLLDLMGKISFGIQSMVAKAEKAEQQKALELSRVPMVYPITQVVQPGAAVTFIADLGGPPAGRQWSVQMLSGLPSPIAANASVVTWYVGQIVPGPAAGQMPVTMARWQFAALPAFEDFSTTIIVLPNEHLLAGITGIPAQSTLCLNAIVADMPYPGPCLV